MINECKLSYNLLAYKLFDQLTIEFVNNEFSNKLALLLYNSDSLYTIVLEN